MKTIITLISTVILMTACHTTPTPSNKYEEIVLATAKSKARDTNTFKLLDLKCRDTITYLEDLKSRYEISMKWYEESENYFDKQTTKTLVEQCVQEREDFGNKKDYIVWYAYSVTATVEDVFGETKPVVMDILIKPDYTIENTLITGTVGTYESERN